MNIIEQLKALPDGAECVEFSYFVRGDGVGVRSEEIDIADLKALAESHERLLKAAKDAADNPGEDGYGDFPPWIDEMKEAIAEAEKL